MVCEFVGFLLNGLFRADKLSNIEKRNMCDYRKTVDNRTWLHKKLFVSFRV